MTLEDLGYNLKLEKYREENNLNSFAVGRVISEHKDRYTVKTETNELDSELIGNLRFTAKSKCDLPVVGDWVAISEYDDHKALIHAVFPRSSVLERKAIGKLSETQIIATNIDVALIIQSVNRDFSINRLERYLTICNSSNIKPIIVLSKIDLIDKNELKSIIESIKKRINNITIINLSNQSLIGLNEIKSILSKGKTYCLLGSSGVGKSTLINNLIGEKIMATGEISDAIDRGKHITTSRELIVSENGVLIDNPGMREVGITSSDKGLEITFNTILNLSNNCKFNNCTHTNEIGCAVLEAIENGIINIDSYNNYIKMTREKEFFESSSIERKKKDKNFGKMVKNVVKQRKKNKF